jgi:hypothetical protein
MVTLDNQIEHCFVHLDVLVMGQGLLLFPIDESLSDLLLEVARLERVDDLKPEVTKDLR